MREPIDVRCFCTRAPLLARCGTDSKTHQPFVHIHSQRNNKVYVEAIVTEGTVRLRCRECLRWHTLRIVQTKVETEQEPLPASIEI